jgi:hypothetical protein
MFFQTGKTVGKETLAPQADHLTARVQTSGDLIVGHTFGCVKDHLGSLNLKIR